MTEMGNKRLNRAKVVLFMSSALVVALFVGMQGRAEGKGWLASIFIGGVAGVLISYAAILVLMLSVAAVRRVSTLIQKK